MKHRNLRGFMSKKRLSVTLDYANKPLVIDELCFKHQYKTSNCQFILGGEYDRFASGLKSMLSIYFKSGIKCYVVFSGAGKANVQTRKFIHQKIIDKTDAIIPGGAYEYCEPIFVKEVYKDILNELEIKNYTCVYGSKETLFSLAKKLKCPILSPNIEYVLYGVSVISFRSVAFNEETQSLTCSIYLDDKCKQWCRLSNDLISVFLTVTDEDSKFYNELLDIFHCRSERYVNSMLYWIRCQSKHSALVFLNNHLSIENRQIFIDKLEELKQLFNSPLNSSAIDFLINDCPISDRKQGLENMSNEQFEYDVGIGRIANHFINLKAVGILSGSWVVYNENREDAMLVATDIALYALGLLTNCQDVKVTFIGRKHRVCEMSVIRKVVNIQTQQKLKRSEEMQNFSEPIDHFINFIREFLPGFNIKKFECIPEDSWIILISLLYYSVKATRNITNVAYSIILSYVVLSPVSEKVGVIKKSNFSVIHNVVHDGTGERTGKNDVFKSNLTHGQCSETADAVFDLFYVQESALKDNFDRDALHTLAEFQYCLQFMNYLNILCGEKIKRTAYHRAINCTFIYNIFVALENENNPGDYIEKILNCSQTYSYFKNITHTYLSCLSLLKHSM